eukprot:1397951-Pleurochrysis_carterae.AAC.11
MRADLPAKNLKKHSGLGVPCEFILPVVARDTWACDLDLPSDFKMSRVRPSTSCIMQPACIVSRLFAPLRAVGMTSNGTLRYLTIV